MMQGALNAQFSDLTPVHIKKRGTSLLNSSILSPASQFGTAPKFSPKSNGIGLDFGAKHSLATAKTSRQRMKAMTLDAALTPKEAAAAAKRRGVTVGAVSRQFSTKTAKEPRLKQPSKKNSEYVDETVAAIIRQMHGKCTVNETMSSLTASQVLATANIKSDRVKLYEENRDKSITTSKNVSKLIDLAPRSPLERKMDIEQIISFSKAQ